MVADRRMPASLSCISGGWNWATRLPEQPALRFAAFDLDNTLTAVDGSLPDGLHGVLAQLFACGIRPLLVTASHSSYYFAARHTSAFLQVVGRRPRSRLAAVVEQQQLRHTGAMNERAGAQNGSDDSAAGGVLRVHLGRRRPQHRLL